MTDAPRPPLPPDEAARLLDLAQYGVFSAGQDAVLDRISRMAARLLNAPAAAVTFVDTDVTRTRGSAGLNLRPGGSDEARQSSFCAWTILDAQPTVVPDLTADARFRDHPAATGERPWRMYAAVPLTTPAGTRIGALCVFDTTPRLPDGTHLELLSDLAELAMNELQLRAELARAARLQDARTEREADLTRGLGNAAALEQIGQLQDQLQDPAVVAQAAAAIIAEAIHLDWTGLVTFQHGVVTTTRVHSAPDLPVALHRLADALNNGEQQGVAQRMEGLSRARYLDHYDAAPGALPGAVAAGLQSVAFVPLGRWADTTYLLLAARTGERQRQPWRESDRHLLEAAARSVQATLQRLAAQQLAEQQARTDALTGTLNHGALQADLPAWHARGAPFTLAVIDLDGFKKVNDTEGHAAGDRVLRVFAGALMAATAEGSATYRSGGDEFVLLLHDQPSTEEIERRVALAVRAASETVACTLGASVGVAGPHDGENLLERADERMYHAKRRRAEQTGAS